MGLQGGLVCRSSGDMEGGPSEAPGWWAFMRDLVGGSSGGGDFVGGASGGSGGLVFKTDLVGEPS